MKNKIILLICTLSVMSCATISYTPKIALDVSPKTIKKTIQIENLIDKMDIKSKQKPFGGYSVTDKSSLAGALSLEVTNAIVEDFNANGVFSKISKREENPDFTIKGEILNFKGKYRPTTAYWLTIPIDLIWFFGVPVMKDEIDIQIKLSVFDKSGKLVGEYYGNSNSSKLYSMYNNGILGLPVRTNRGFTEAISQIREKIIFDIDKFN